MCGILGQLDFQRPIQGDKAFHKALDTLSKRGAEYTGEEQAQISSSKRLPISCTEVNKLKQQLLSANTEEAIARIWARGVFPDWRKKYM